MSHLAGNVHRGDKTLDEVINGVLLVRAHTPCWLKGLCALTGGLSLRIARGYDQRADLTSRFIKTPTVAAVPVDVTPTPNMVAQLEPVFDFSLPGCAPRQALSAAVGRRTTACRFSGALVNTGTGCAGTVHGVTTIYQEKQDFFAPKVCPTCHSAYD
jgi:hypothetical protein